MAEFIFEVIQEADGGYVAECLTEPIVTQGDDWAELRTAVSDAVQGCFFDSPAPQTVRLHLVSPGQSRTLTPSSSPRPADPALF